MIRFRGKTYLSTGSVPPGEHAWTGPSPGALHVASDDFSHWIYRVGYPADATRDVWRLTFLARFRDRLYAGIQEYYPRESHDCVVFAPPPYAKEISANDMRAVTVTETGGAQTLRWFADRNSLYWIAIDHDGSGHVRVTTDGDSWQPIDLPSGSGYPSDILRWGDSLVLLTENKLYRIEGHTTVEIASWADPKIFAVNNFFCAPPLALFRGNLYAGSQKDGSLLRFVAD